MEGGGRGRELGNNAFRLLQLDYSLDPIVETRNLSLNQNMKPKLMQK